MALIGNPGGYRLGSVGPRESWVVSQRSVENCDTCIRCQTQERMAFKSADNCWEALSESQLARFISR